MEGTETAEMGLWIILLIASGIANIYQIIRVLEGHLSRRET